MKKPPLLLTLGTAVVLIGGGAAAYWFLTRRGASPEDLPVGSDVVPQDALLTISVSTNERQWRTLRTFGTPETQAAFDQQLANLRDRILEANGLNYEENIQPWVGDEITVAFLPPASVTASEESAENAPDTEENTAEEDAAEEPLPLPPELQGLDTSQPVAIVLPIANPVKAQEALGSTKTAEGWTEREYKGIALKESQSDDATPYSAATLGSQFVVVTTDPKATEQVIDAYKDQPAIADTPGYRDAFRTIQAPDVFAKLYVNVPVAADLANQNLPQPVPPQGLSPIQDSQGLAATMTLETDGIRFQGITWLKADSDRRYQVRNDAGQMPQRLPADTLLMVSGGNFQQFWQDYTQNAQARPLTPFHPDNIRSGFESMTGLSWEEEMLPWMAGEFSLALVPTPPAATSVPESQDAPPPQAGVAPLLMMQVSDRNQAEQAFEKLDEALTSRYRFQIQEAEVNSQPVVNWISPFASLTLTRGWLDQDTLFLALGESATRTIIPAPNATLAESQPFRTTVAMGPSSNNGHFFINLDRLLSADSSVPLPPLPPQSQEVASAIQAIGVTAATQDARTARYDIYVVLEKGDRPKALPSPQLEETPPQVQPSPEAEPEPSPE